MQSMHVPDDEADQSFWGYKLPAQSTPLIGREGELAALRATLQNPGIRLITLFGPAGVGKTRLALQFAETAHNLFEDGITLVELHTLHDINRLPITIAQALGIVEPKGQTIKDAIVQYLSPRHLLLLLDNFEQILPAAGFLAKLLAECLRLTLLVTSRGILNISSEHVFYVASLSLPDPKSQFNRETILQSSGVQLFFARARAINPVIQINDVNCSAAASICRKLDGLPLAIELAAGWLSVFSPPDLLVQLEHRLKILNRGPRDLPARQQSLRAAIEWSYDLLAPEEKALFRCIAVFEVGGSLEAIEAVIGMLRKDIPSVLETMAGLVEQSMLLAVGSIAGHPRFSMLQTLREYGLEQVKLEGEESALRAAQAGYYALLAEKAENGLRGPDQQIWRDRLEIDLDNLRSAIAWSTREGADPTEAETGLRIAGELGYFWFQRGFPSEGREWLAKALVASSDRGRLHARGLLSAGTLAWRQGDYAEAARFLEEGLQLARSEPDVEILAESLHVLGHVKFDQQAYLAAREMFIESYQRFLDAKDPAGVVPLTGDLGMVAYHTGDYQTAQDLFSKSLDLAYRYKLQDRVADALIRLGDLARIEQHLPNAIRLYEAGLKHWQEQRSTPGIASALHKLGQAFCLTGNLSAARNCLMESLVYQRDLGNKQGLAECLAAITGLVLTSGDPVKAAKLAGAASELLNRIGAPLAPADQQAFVQTEVTLGLKLDIEIYKNARIEGQALLDEAALAFALSVLENSAPADPPATPIDHRSSKNLSPREQQVAVLLTRGLSNKAIAAALSITEKTASNHIDHILAKLDLRSRTQIAIWAVQNGLASPDIH